MRQNKALLLSDDGRRPKALAVNDSQPTAQDPHKHTLKGRIKDRIAG